MGRNWAVLGLWVAMIALAGCSSTGTGPGAERTSLQRQAALIVGAWDGGDGILEIQPGGGAVLWQSDNREMIRWWMEGDRLLIAVAQGEHYTVLSVDEQRVTIGQDDDVLTLSRVPWIGSWRSASMSGGIENEITVMYLDLLPSGRFVAQMEGPDAEAPIQGTYTVEGRMLELADRYDTFTSWSFRFADDVVRASTGNGGLIILQRD